MGIPNKGQKEFKAQMTDGSEKILTAQVCDVNKALLSVKKVVASGNRVVFDPERAYIENVYTGEKMPMDNANGMYTLKMWVTSDAQVFRGKEKHAEAGAEATGTAKSCKTK